MTVRFRIPRPALPALHRKASAALLGLACLAGCQSTDPLGQLEPVDPSELEIQEEPITTGFLVTDLGNRIEGWNRAKLEARGQRDYLLADSRRQDVKRLVVKHFDELLHEFEVGPPNTRTVVASALGFSESPRALGPLMLALDDTDELVIGNALLGLAMLGQPDTPLDRVCFLLRESGDPYNRNNAAFCLQRLVDAGAEGDCVLPSARAGIEDRQAGVRLSCAWVLGRLSDGESLDGLGALLGDVEARVAQSAAHSIRRIGQTNDEHKGAAARLLLAAHGRREGALRDVLRLELARLRGADLGNEMSEWRRWAYSLP